jgi:hypothetical protein
LAVDEKLCMGDCEKTPQRRELKNLHLVKSVARKRLVETVIE